MSDSEEENFCFFGKPLEPYDENAFPKKKPISVEDQVATDAQGRRRFHGAFTGGFSAGFFNTVGSLEGWRPSEFRSTRQDKTKNVFQKPEDFMDDEDLGEHGIAPQTIRATSDYSTSKKRRREVFADGPIPGEPVLHTLLTSGNETVGYLLLKNIGLQDKIDQQEILNSPNDRIYGCQMPKSYEIPLDVENKQYKVPQLYKDYLEKPKSNTFGLGYEGLDKSHINLFQTSALVVTDKNKKLSIAGQAFGVGAFEEEDDDIYMKEDMSKYDFELTSEKVLKSTKPKINLIHNLFVPSKINLLNKKQYPPPNIPHSFSGKHKIKKSRFEPIPEENVEVGRKEMNPNVRAKYLGENVSDTYTPSKTVLPVHQSSRNNQTNETVGVVKVEVKKEKETNSQPGGLLFDRFVSASQTEDVSNILEEVKHPETEHGTQEMRNAARMKMFGPLTRITIEWKPCALLCKRFNVPEPLFDDSISQNRRRRTKNLIFEYQKHTQNDGDFTPGLSLKKSEESPNEDVKDVSPQMVDLSERLVEDTDNVEHNQEEQLSQSISVSSIIENETNGPFDVTAKLDIDKNVDLFKAVFLSSSESEDEIPENTDEKTEELKSNVLSDSFIPKIRPLKEGILSNVDFSQFKKAEVDKGILSSVSTKDLEPKIDLYGPTLPDRNPINQQVTNISLNSSEEDEWVEKDREKKKKKHKKKHKKDKHSHKRDRHDKRKK